MFGVSWNALIAIRKPALDEKSRIFRALIRTRWKFFFVFLRVITRGIFGVFFFYSRPEKNGTTGTHDRHTRSVGTCPMCDEALFSR